MRRQGFSLLELLLASVLMGSLFLVVLALGNSSITLRERERARGRLADELSLTATVLARELYTVGYRLTGQALALSPDSQGDSLQGWFLCEAGMEELCGESLGQIRGTGYAVDQGALRWGACTGAGCAPSPDNPVLGGDEVRVEAFRVAYLEGDAWKRQAQAVNLGQEGASPKVSALALYLLASAPVRGGAPAFTPGSTLIYPPGLSPSLLELPAVANDGRLRAEKLWIVQTPNLAR
ncbi:prepilin-type N-terminal cleavage/methylation domain-containing protein [Thermus sp.]|jgi:prepilin-type N-terminal cleavage/methylation domain-containing protein|uniref:prepilin-type N-terminal cleavage/methylation domain-containing protein n=1 Tax=Thermus sp. TaxID=275 RepID=UPI0032209760